MSVIAKGNCRARLGQYIIMWLVGQELDFMRQIGPLLAFVSIENVADTHAKFKLIKRALAAAISFGDTPRALFELDKVALL